MMGPQHIERMDDRLDAIETGLRTALEANGRVVSRNFEADYRNYRQADVEAGLVVLVSDGEGDYSERLGMAAREGTMNVLLPCYVKVDAQNGTPGEVEAVELDLAEEIKAFVRTGVTGVSLALEEIRNSRQQEFPYGWVVAVITAGPPRATTH